jgi:hypothetical protein
VPIDGRSPGQLGHHWNRANYQAAVQADENRHILASVAQMDYASDTRDSTVATGSSG